MRRSACRPDRSTTAQRVSPCAVTCVTSLNRTKAFAAAGASVDATRMSTSPTVSERRRKLPATSSCCTPGVARSAATSGRTYASASASGTRAACALSCARPRRIDCWMDGPRPRSVASRPARAAFSSWPSVRTPSFWLMSRARLGPMPGIRSSVTRLPGVFFLSCSSSGSSPVRHRCSILPARSAPMPGRSSRRSPFFLSSDSTGALSVPTVRAAVR